MTIKSGMSSHQSAAAKKEEWLTPPWLLKKLGAFDLDPCAATNRPWDTAKNHYTVQDDGLAKPWFGHVFLNPPYGTKTGAWLNRLAEHNSGVALIFARTETKMFFTHVWGKASAVLFIRGRLTFHHANGVKGGANGGAPSVLVAYGDSGLRTLSAVRSIGQFICLSNRRIFT